MRLALTAGGTGGHIFPALAVLDALRARPGLLEEVRWFGPDNRGERTLVEAAGLRFEAVTSAPVLGRGPLALLRSAFLLLGGTWSAFRKLRAFGPDAVFSTGGYASFPGALAARLLRLPLVVYLPDVSPGWAVRAEMRLASRMATTADAALAFLPRKKTVVTGYPVRDTFLTTTREVARRQLGLDPGEKVLLVAGASQGAAAINRAVFAALPRFLAEMRVYHVTGPAGYDEAAGLGRQLAPELAGRYVPAPFRDDLPVVMLAADLAVLRAGASTLGELTAARLPAVMIPGTFAGGHQRHNAKWLADAGAALIVEESAIAGLADCVFGLINDEERLAAMRAAAKGLARPGAADAIADLIVEAAR
ncbi:MAG: UDP-N-acetylglucosamine--N-acetylmuramyl-(pentapeptide) pyrophosphoryl-undecaprenol N-acetylglucosamine transferase [Dehalococcoidia bacterium]